LTLIDSSGWLEFFTDGPLAEKYASYLSDLPQILTPIVVLYEVYKKIRRERGEEDALVALILSLCQGLFTSKSLPMPE
jgi:hypothetical protein